MRALKAELEKFKCSSPFYKALFLDEIQDMRKKYTAETAAKDFDQLDVGQKSVVKLKDAAKRLCNIAAASGAAK